MNLDYTLLIPEYILIGAAFAIVALSLLMPKSRPALPYLTALAAVVAGAISLLYADMEKDFGALISVDAYTTFFRVFFAATVAAVALSSAQFVNTRVSSRGEYYGLLLLSTAGAITMASARELITAYVGLELLSFSLYVLASFLRSDPRSNEGGIKYMLLGAFSSAILLYGLSVIYGVTGATEYGAIADALRGGTEGLDFALLFGLMFVIAGLGFKVSAVPFHMWAPDAYEGAPLPITAYISTTSKAAGFALLLRLFAEGFSPAIEQWRWAIAALATATMILGNLVAIQQHNIKRLMAYSSIGQVGYMLIAIVALSPDSGSAMLLHLTGYVISAMAAFTAILMVYNRTGKEEIADFAGMAERNPFIALSITIALFSFAGMPLFAGFLTKFILFQAAANEGYLWLAAIGAFASFVSLYYYLLIIKQMYVGEPGPEGRLSAPRPMYALLAVLVLGVIAVGVYPRPLFHVADQASQQLFSQGDR